MISAPRDEKESALLKESTARCLLVAVFLVMLVLQGLYLAQIGNKLTILTDGFSEANALRAAEAYIKEGVTSFHGLPRQAYGTRFPDAGYRSAILEKDGTIKWEMRKNLRPECADANKWVYTHYPEGPDVMLSFIGRIAGLDHLLLLRLFPLALCLVATAYFFASLARAFGTDRAVLIAAACIMLPMFNTYMPGLHFQGYAFALLLIQTSLLIRIFWAKTDQVGWRWSAFFLLGFLQGWFSFDLFFVVTLIAWPLWLLRRSEGGSPSARQLILCITLPCIGFGFAHCLHFLQVAGEMGGIQGAITEYRMTATERAGGIAASYAPDIFQKGIFKKALQATEHSSYLQTLLLACYQYLRDFLHPGCFQFCPMLPIASLALIPVLMRRPIRVVLSKKQAKPSLLVFSWPERGSPLPALVAAFVVSSLWLVVMAGHALGNHHFTVRHFFVFYLFMIITIAKSIQIIRETADSRASRPGKADFH